MVIVLTPQTEARLCEKARRDGIDLDSLAETLIASSLDWEGQDRAVAAGGIKAALKDGLEAKVKSFAAFQTDMRTKYGFSDRWPEAPNEADDLALASLRVKKPEDQVGQHLHLRKVQGESLTDEELATLHIWYDVLDAEETAMFAKNRNPYIDRIKQEIIANEQRLREMETNNQEIAAKNEAIRAEIALLRRSPASASQTI
jgi:hypothetical protein